MHTSIQKLHALLNALQGKDLALLNPEAIAELRQTATSQFVAATAGLNTLLLGKHSDSPRWLWKAEEAEHFGGEWIATYSIVDTRQMESAIGKHKTLQLAAAIFPGIVFKIDLFAEYHHPGGTGMQVDPRLTVSVRCSGDPELALIEYFLELSSELFPRHGEGLTVEILPMDCCCDWIVNPSNIHEAYATVAAAARKAGLEENGDATMTENVDLILTMDRSITQEAMYQAFETMGELFTSVIVSQK